jgi:hypothetical protein
MGAKALGESIGLCVDTHCGLSCDAAVARKPLPSFGAIGIGLKIGDCKSASPQRELAGAQARYRLSISARSPAKTHSAASRLAFGDRAIMRFQNGDK